MHIFLDGRLGHALSAPERRLASSLIFDALCSRSLASLSARTRPQQASGSLKRRETFLTGAKRFTRSSPALAEPRPGRRRRSSGRPNSGQKAGGRFLIPSCAGEIDTEPRTSALAVLARDQALPGTLRQSNKPKQGRLRPLAAIPFPFRSFRLTYLEILSPSRPLGPHCVTVFFFHSMILSLKL